MHALSSFRCSCAELRRAALTSLQCCNSDPYTLPTQLPFQPLSNACVSTGSHSYDPIRAALYSFGNSCSVKECEICMKDNGDGSASSAAVNECTRAGARFLYRDGRARLDVSRRGMRDDATWDCLRERGVNGVDALRRSSLWIRSPFLRWI